MTVGSTSTAPKRLSLLGFAVVVIAYLAIIKGVGYAVGEIWDVDDLHTTKNVILGMWLPLGAAFLFTYAVAAYLGWLRPVLHDDRPVPRWVWAVPIIFAVCIAPAIDYADLADTSVGYVLALLEPSSSAGVRRGCSAASVSRPCASTA